MGLGVRRVRTVYSKGDGAEHSAFPAIHTGACEVQGAKGRHRDLCESCWHKEVQAVRRWNRRVPDERSLIFDGSCSTSSTSDAITGGALNIASSLHDAFVVHCRRQHHRSSELSCFINGVPARMTRSSATTRRRATGEQMEQTAEALGRGRGTPTTKPSNRCRMERLGRGYGAVQRRRSGREASDGRVNGVRRIIGSLVSNAREKGARRKRVFPAGHSVERRRLRGRSGGAKNGEVQSHISTSQSIPPQQPARAEEMSRNLTPGHAEPFFRSHPDRIENDTARGTVPPVGAYLGPCKPAIQHRHLGSNRPAGAGLRRFLGIVSVTCAGLQRASGPNWPRLVTHPARAMGDARLQPLATLPAQRRWGTRL